MDIDDIMKFATRKRINTDAEKLSERVSREAENIIKLKVAQDTAYWDLKEKLQQVESNHESLQQKMAEVQMQHEAANAKYQEELRQRPETLNKLSSTRQICDVLQESSERLRETLLRCKADGAALCHAFNKSAEKQRELQQKRRQEDQETKHQLERLQEKVSLSNKHHNQLLQYVTSAKQQVEAELVEVRGQLTSVHTRKDELLTTLGDVSKDLDKHKYELAKKDEMLTTIQSQMKKMTEEYNLTIAQKDKDYQGAVETCTSLKQALSNHEQFTRSVCDERNALQEKMAALEKEQLRQVAIIDALKTQIQETTSAKAVVEENLAKSTKENIDLKKEIFEYIQELTNKKREVEDFQIHVKELEKEKTELASEMRQNKDESDEKSVRIEQLLTEKKMLEEHIVEIENDAKSFKEMLEDKQKNMETKLQAQGKEIETKMNTITSLMLEMETVTQEKFKLEDTMVKLQKEIELERDVTKEKIEKSEKQIKMLQDNVREKEAQLSQNMSILHDIRNEKERLLERIQEMQETMDNVQKELMGRRRPPANRFQPELDDNAVMLTPSREMLMKEPAQKKLKFVQQPSAPEALIKHNSLFDMLSDNSIDAGKGDGLNNEVVQRSFATISRADTPSRSTLTSLKQRPNGQEDRNKTQKCQFAQGAVPNPKPEVKTRPRKFFKSKRLETNDRFV